MSGAGVPPRSTVPPFPCRLGRLPDLAARPDRSLRRLPQPGVHALLALALLALAGCQWESWTPNRPISMPATAPQGGIVMVYPCEPVQVTLDCTGERRSRECNHWYRTDLAEPGELRVRLHRIEFERERALTRLLVRPLGKPVIGQQVSTDGEPLEIRARVAPDVYGMLVQGGGGRRSYELLVTVRGEGEDEPVCPSTEPASAPEEGDEEPAEASGDDLS